MSIKINHTTDSITSTGSSYIYFPGSTLSPETVITNSLYSGVLYGELAPSSISYTIDAGGGVVLSPTIINWFNTLTPATTLTVGQATPSAFTANKRFIMVAAVGGGGGGEAGIVGNTYNASGGGAGSSIVLIYDLWNITTNASPKFNATIGAGGAGGTTANPSGSSGADTIFNIYDPTGSTILYTLTAAGGPAAASPGDGQYSQSQALVAHNTMYRDGLLGTGTNGTTAFAGYGGQASMLAVGANGGNAATTPTAGGSAAANSGAGGGGGALYNVSRTNGGAGGSGVIKIYYF